jgi:uncharacterized protein YqhQ
MSEKLPFYGGQALIEGVLMRGSHTAVAAIKGVNGEIHIHQEELGGIYQGWVKTTPFARGIIALWDALVLGTRFLTISANLQTDNPDEKVEGGTLYLTIGFSLVFGALLFFVVPASLSHLIEQWLPPSAWLGNLIEGLIRVAIMIGYLVAIRKIPDIKRVFMYHGAEHKTINAFEAGAELTPEAVSKHTVFHPRCGTGFLLTVVLFSIIVFSLLGPLSLPLRIASRLVFIIPLASISYEYIRWTAKHLDNPIIKLVIAPNLWLQKLTTAEPSMEMLEIAITSLREVIKKETLVQA